MKKYLLKYFLALFLILSLFPCFPFHADASGSFSFDLDKTKACREELVRLRLRSTGTGPVPAGFRIRIFFDADAVKYVGTEASGRLEDGTVETNAQSGEVCSVYVCNTGKGYAPSLPETVITYVFSVREDAEFGDTALRADMDQICDYEGNSLPDCAKELSVRIVPQDSPRAYLTKLVPSAGKLRPDFSPDVFEYTLSVDDRTDSVEFGADAGEGGSVKASRKTLGRPGTDTAIILTAVSADKKLSQNYLITVHRGVRPASSQGEASSSAKPDGRAAPPKERAGTGGSSNGPGSSGAESGRQNEREARVPDSPHRTETAAAPVPAAVESAEPMPTESYPKTASPSAVEWRENWIPVAEDTQSSREIQFIGNTMPLFLYRLAAVLLFMTAGAALWHRARAARREP